MVMVADSLPGLKGVLQRSGLRGTAAAMATRLIAAFILHPGRMSCLQAAAVVRSDSRHRAQVSRFLAKGAKLVSCVGEWFRDELMRHESSLGTYVFIVDATLCGQAGKHTENTYSTGNRKRRPRKGRRHGTYRYHRRSCHSFTAGLLLTPFGLRIPVLKPYYTRGYCKARGLDHCTTAEAAAFMVRELKVPAGTPVVVVGDTAYESQVVREACEARGFRWIFRTTMNGCRKDRRADGYGFDRSWMIDRLGHGRPSGLFRAVGHSRRIAASPGIGSGRK